MMETGSGAEKPIEGRIIREIRKIVLLPIIVGSGISTPLQAKEAIESGEDIIDTGSVLEKSGTIREIVEAVKTAKRPKSLRD
jgi:phosphoglycerol geranylgeranyltransferase